MRLLVERGLQSYPDRYPDCTYCSDTDRRVNSQFSFAVVFRLNSSQFGRFSGSTPVFSTGMPDSFERLFSDPTLRGNAKATTWLVASLD